SGTLGFIAPELLRGEHADHATDVFSVGCTLQALASIATFTPAPVKAIAARAVRSNPSERPSVDEIIQALGSGQLLASQTDPWPETLVGRDDQVAVIDAFARALETDEGPRVLVVVGERRSGRTRLVAEARWRASITADVFDAGDLHLARDETRANAPDTARP